MIPLFGGQPKSRWNCLEITIRAVPINLAGAIASSILALGYFGVAFATGEAGRTFPTSVIVILAVIVVAVAAVAAVLAVIAAVYLAGAVIGRIAKNRMRNAQARWSCRAD